MPLSNEAILKIVKEKKDQKEVQQGIRHQQRLQFHTETVLHKDDLSPYYTDFKNWIGGQTPELLAADKFERFKQLIKAPIQTIELTESIYSRLFRIFYSQDSYFNYRFTDDNLEDDWEDYRDDKFWRTVGFKAMQTAIDSVWVAALPSMQVTTFPEPVNKLINIENVIEIKNDAYNNCIYVIFQLGDYVYVYDDISFRVFSDIDNVVTPVAEVAHDLGYTPARMMWSESLTSTNHINKESPITKELTDLDWLLFHMTSKRYMDLANAYPITVTYDMDGDYQDDDTTENEQRVVGKRPSGAHLTGAGSHLHGPAPRGAEEHDPLQYGPVKIIAPPIETLKWHVEEEIRLTEKIFKAVVGTDQLSRNDTAKNEMQVESAFESQKSVLFRVKKNFEIIHEFADRVICGLRYGERFLDCDIDYGTNFFLKDVNDLQEELQSAKDAGSSEAILESINANILHTKYRDDDKSITRANIINDLDPLPNRTLKEAIELYKEGGIDKINFIIKSNLINFVKRFERENTSVVNFGSLTSYNRKIDQLLKEFRIYAQEMSGEVKEEEKEIVKPNIIEDELIEETPGDI